MKKWILIIGSLLILISRSVNIWVLGDAINIHAWEVEKLIGLIILLGFSAWYIRRLVRDTMYSYKVMSNLGVLIFLAGQLLFQIYRLVVETSDFSLANAYQRLLDSFAIHAYIMWPMVIVLSILMIVSNVILIRKNGWRLVNSIGILMGILMMSGSFVGLNIYYWLEYYLGEYSIIGRAWAYAAEAVICMILAYFECLLIASIICTLRSARYRPPFNQDFMIILGCRVEPNGCPGKMLRDRVQLALDFGLNQAQTTKQTITYIPSGGQGSDEVISEAAAMSSYLQGQGVAPAQILMEDQSTSTRENMLFSKKIIDQKKTDARTVFATTGYHVFRSGVLAHRLGLKAVGIGCPTKWYYYINAFLREFIASVHVERQQHIFNLTFMLAGIVGMILFGIYWELI